MVTRLLGRKLGMTQVYTEKGQCFPVTVIEAGPCTVTQVKTKDKDGYAAIQIAWDGKEEVKVGAKIDCGIFESWKKIDVEGISKGRGFMGVVRRWGFHG